MKSSLNTKFSGSKTLNNSEKAIKLLASSIFKQLQEEGCEPRDIISVSSQLIDLVTTEISKDESSNS